MKYSFNAAGVGEALVGSFKIGATVIAGQVVIWDGANGPGQLADATTTSGADAFGVTLGAGTYSTTQGTGASSAEVNVEVVYSPMAVFESNISGAAAAGTQLSASTSNYLTNSTASAGGTTCTSSSVGTASMAGGLLFAVTGNNKGASRVVTTHNNSTSLVVTVPFDYALAAGDKFVVLPLGSGIQTAQLCTELNEVDATIVVATGIAANVINVKLDVSNESYPVGSVFMSLRDHFLNPLS